MSQQINLFNPVFMKQRKYLSLPAMLQALGLIVLGYLLFYVYAFYQVGLLKGRYDESSKRYAAELVKFERSKAEFSPELANKALQSEALRLDKMLAEQSELIETLKAEGGGNTAGYSEYMRAFARQTVQGVWLTGFQLVGDGAQISLKGGVLNPGLLPVYIQRLGKEPVMQGRTFANLQMSQPKTETGYVEFALQSGEGEARK